MKRSADNFAVGIGWFSIALGLAELLAPRAMARAAGLHGHETLVRLYGVREIATGVAILAAWDRKPWLWSRVAGDAVDLATLARGRRPNSALAMAAVAGVTAADIATAARLQRADRAAMRPVFDYSDRSGFPKPAAEMRGAALKRGQTPFQERERAPA
jgi:hypothetical protein